MSGENVFLTGVAGSGKSYLINAFIAANKFYKRNLLALAPTGIAAINIGGMTIHKLIRWKGKPIVTMRPKAIKELTAADVILIDEISMCRLDLFEFLMKCVEKSNAVRRKQNKKPIQIIVSGDFSQLPPVISSSEKDILISSFGPDIVSSEMFCFLSSYWEKQHFTILKLQNVIRQKDKEFSDSLEKLRVGDISSIDWINSHSSKEENDGIVLSSWNREVNIINDEKLEELKTKSRRYIATIDGDYPDSFFPTKEDLELKVGCRVMALNNDKDFLYQNGSLGTVKELLYDSVIVKFDNGYEAKISEHVWENKKYSVEHDESGNSEIVEDILGSFKQIPLKLAYAITIHKSQGQTFDKIILNPDTFASGQLYVALSRVSNVEGLYLKKEIKPQFLKTSKYVIDFEKKLNSISS